MRAIRLSRATLALLIIGVMISGVALGSALTVMAVPSATPTRQPVPTLVPSPAPTLPEADVAGEDLERLPRYPGSVRTGYSVSRDEQYQLVALAFVTAASIDEVRLFYQQVVDDQGWERADVRYVGGAWTYVLVEGRTEALVEIETTAGLVEIDLQVSHPLAEPTPIPVPEATQRPTPRPTPQPIAPPQPEGDDGGEDDGGEGESDDGGGDG